MAPTEGCFPTELIDNIIDEAAVEKSLRGSTFSSMALVSHGCRHRVNKHRFSKISMGVHKTVLPRIQALAQILTSGMWQKNVGVTHHVRSVTLVLGKVDNRNLRSNPSISQAIASILNIIFQGDGTLAHNDSAYTVAIETADYRYADVKGPVRGLPFTILDPTLVGVLYNICQNPSLNTLSLKNIWDVPSSMILSSTITKLLLERAHFARSEIENMSSRNVFHLRNLKYLSLTMSPSLLGSVLGSTAEFPSSLEVVQFRINFAGGYDVLRRLGKSIAHLILTIVHDSESDVSKSGIDCSFIDYSGFSRLQVLEIFLTDGLCPYFTDKDFMANETEPPYPVFLRLFNLMPVNIPPRLLIHFEIELDYLHDVISSHSGIDQLYRQMYHPSLVRLLERCSDHSQITLDFEIYVNLPCDFSSTVGYASKSLDKQYEVYLRGILSDLDEINGLSLLISVETFSV